MKFIILNLKRIIIIIYTTNKLTVVEMEDIRGVRLRKFNLRKIILGVRMHFHHNLTSTYTSWTLDSSFRYYFCEQFVSNIVIAAHTLECTQTHSYRNFSTHDSIRSF